jgi:hypothetical protein
MSTITELVNGLGTGWKVSGTGNPVEETAPVVVRDPTGVDPDKTVNRGTGRYYVVVQDPEGHQRALFLKAQPVTTGVGGQPSPIQVKQSGVNDTDPSQVISDPEKLKTLAWDQAGPVADVPKDTTKDVSKLEDLRKIDADGNDASKSGKPAAKLYDDKTGQSYPIDRDKPSYTSFGDDLVQINPDGSTKTLLSKPDKPSTVTVPGVGLVEYDPTTHTAKTIAATPKGLQANQLQPRESNGKTYIPYDTDEGVAWKEAEGLPANVTWTSATNDPRSQYIQLIGSNGETKNIPKPPDWKPPPSPQAGQALSPDTTSPFVVTIGDNGQPVFTENKNRASISEAQKDLIQQLGGKVADGSMTEQQAKDLIASTTQAMTAQAAKQNAQANMLQAQTQQQNLGVQAGSDILSNIQNAAQTGAGVLQNRVTNATGALQNLVGQAAGAKNLMSVPSGLGQQLVGGIQSWATELGGGQDVYDSAANLVKRADPNNGLGGDAANAYSALGQMLQKYRDLTGQPHPAEAIANQPQQNAPFPAPTTTPQQVLNQQAAGQQLAAATANPANAPFGAIGNNPMLAAQQAYNRAQASRQTAAATQQFGGGPFGAIGASPFLAPVTVVAPPPQTVTV